MGRDRTTERGRGATGREAAAKAAPEAFYFGCVGQDGHAYYTPGLRTVPYSSTPWGSGIDSRKLYDERQRQGVARLHHKDGWTALQFADRTGDSRGNSHSAFLFHATLTFDEALAAARERFPSLFERFTFEVVPEPGASAPSSSSEPGPKGSITQDQSASGGEREGQNG